MKVFESKFTLQELTPLNKVLQTGQLGFGSNVLKFENQFQSFSNKKFLTLAMLLDEPETVPLMPSSASRTVPLMFKLSRSS